MVVTRCSACQSRELQREEAPAAGTLYTFTVIRELGRQREGFIPYAVGQVDLHDDLRVMGIVVAPPDRLSVGMRVRTTLLPQGKDEDGRSLVGYAFAPEAE